MKKLFAVIAGLALSFSVLAAAPDKETAVLSYDYVEAQYTVADLDYLDRDHGVGVVGSKSLGETLFVRASFNRLNDGASPNDDLRVGLGARFGLSENLDAYGLVSAVKTVNAYPFTTDSFGTAVEGGVRFAAFDSLELRAGVSTERLAEGSKEWSTYGLVGATLAFSDLIGLSADVKADENGYQGLLGVRFAF